MLTWIKRARLFFCRQRASSLPAECFIELLLSWANSGYDLVILECRPGIGTKIITRINREYETINTLDQESTDAFFRDMEKASGDRQINDYMCSTKTAVMIVEDVAFTVEISMLPVIPAGSDVGIRITGID